MQRKSKFILISVAIFAFVLVGACSSSKSDDQTQSLEAASTKEDSTGLNASATLLAQGIIKADGSSVYAQISSECQLKVSRTEVSKQLRTAKAYLTSFLGARLEDFEVESVETRKVVKGKTGQARYTIKVNGESRDALAKFQEEQDAKKASSTAPQSGGVTSTTQPDIVLPFDEPTDWFDFVYESSSWRLQSCEEFLEASGLVQVPNSSTSTTAK
jgi:hypothetical protein